MAPTRDDNARDKRSVLRPNPATFLKDFALYMTHNIYLYDTRADYGKTRKSKFLYGPVSPNFCARRSVMMILNLSESLAKPLVMAELNMAYLSSLNKRAKLLSSYLPVSPSRVLRAPGTSPFHLVPKHLRATWPRPEQSHLLPEACSPDGTDKRRQRQRQTERPPPEPSNILKRFCALYDAQYIFI